jgi:hypothetical protein
MANYPGSAPSFSDKSPGQTIASAHMDAVQDEITAIGSALLAGITHPIVLTSGQIAFPATQAASSGANTLDDYEEGTWTPVIGGAGGTSGQTYTSQSGTYVKIGKQVWFGGEAVLTNKGTITGDVQIQGLPFTVGSANGDRGILTFFWNGLANNFVYITAFTVASGTVATLYGAGGAVASLTALATANIDNASGLAFSGCYRASA